jgi:hypothetical protein
MRIFVIATVLGLLLIPSISPGQTSWKGTSNTDWSRASNWTAGVPTATTDAIIGDASFTGSNQPTLSANTSFCKSLTIGTGTKVSVLTIPKALSVSGNITIGAKGTINHSGKNISLTGNWSNSGSYSPNGGASVSFNGTTESISGPTSFRKLNINAGSTTSLNASISANNQLYVNGVLNPGEAPTFSVSGSGKLSVDASGTIYVKASTFAGNYNLTGVQTFANTSVVDYAATTVNQTVSNSPTYGNLRISGALTKTLAGNLPPITGNLTVVAGTLDLGAFTANRASAGGSLLLANGTTLKIGGTNSFPSNYTTRSIGATSTVIYSGTNQTVSAQSYGNLSLTSSSGSATKTMPASAMTVSGSLTSSVGSGTSVSFTAAAALTVNGDLTIGTSTTFNGGASAHTFGGNWTNNGTFTGATSTVTLSGANKSISGTGASTFNSLVASGPGLTVAPTTNITVAGNLSTSGAGTFSQTGGGTITMSGAAKTIAGSGITFNNFTALGSISAATSLTIAGNLAVSGSLTGNSGTVTMSGASKTIGGAGTITFNALNVSGSVSTTSNFSIKSDFSAAGTFSATAGTATFSGSSTLSGSPAFFNVVLNGTKLQLATGAVLGIGGTLTITAGTFDVTTTTPNSVDYNASGAQTIAGTNYDNLSLSTGGIKTATGGLTVAGDLTINTGATFSGSTFTHSVAGNWINSGTFTAGTSNVQFTGSADASITGTTTFNTLTLNKSTSANLLVLNTSVTVSTLAMTSGTMHTGINSITITSSRTGNGIVIGTIIRTNAFSDGVSYAFEGPNNTVTFASGSGSVSSITMSVTQAPIADFVFGGAINREYDVSVASGGSYQAALRLHYEDGELNGNIKSLLREWTVSGITWVISGVTASDSVNNWVEQSGLASIAGRWSLSDSVDVANWTGSVSSAWEDGGNWSTVQGHPSIPPSRGTIVLFGGGSTPNQPVLSTLDSVKNIVFESAQATNVTIGNGGSLVVRGNIAGQWVSSAAHSIDVGSQSLTIGGSVLLSDGTAGNSINLNVGSGSATIAGSLTQSGDATISWNGAGSLSIAGDFNRTGGTFSAGSGSVTYNGPGPQVVAGGVSYHDLMFDKAGGTATLSSPANVSGNLTLSKAGTFAVNAPLAVSGGVTINAGTTLDGGTSSIAVGGDWTRTGTFNAGTGTVTFNGSGAQSIGGTAFNNLTINKSGGVASPTTNLSINGDLSVSSGTLDLLGLTANRSAVGGTMSLTGSAVLRVGGSLGFPTNFSTYSIASTSTVEYYGASTQIVGAQSYGNLTFSNGGSNVKILSGTTAASGTLLINNGATLDAGSFAASVGGNWTNNGTFTPSASTITLAGSGTLSGTTAFENLNVSGSYTASSDITVTGTANVSGSYQASSTSTIFSGDFTNTGSFASGGTVTFTGGSPQALSLNSNFSSTGTVNFNGTISPSFSDNSGPILTNVTINNTGGITPDVDWDVAGAFTVANGALFNDGSLSYIFGGAFTNNGTVISTGVLVFSPSTPVTLTFLGTAFTTTGYVDFSGSGDITVAGGAPTFASVLLDNTSVDGVTPASNWTVTGDLFIGSGSILNGGAGLLHTLSGNWTNDGTFNGGTSTVVLNSAGGASIAGAGNSTFNNLTISGLITASSPFNVSGDFADNGTFDATGATVSFTGSTHSSIGGSASPVPFDQVSVAKNSATATLAANLSGVSDLSVLSGTLDLSTFTVTQVGTGGVLDAEAGGFLEVGGSNTLPTFAQYTFDPGSTVTYNGTGSQTVLSAPVYGNLVISSSGTAAPDGALTLAGSFLLTAGTFVGGAYSHSVGGNWGMTGGIFTNAGTTIVLNGAGSQIISSTGDLSGLTINKPSGSCTAGSNITVDGQLTFTSGNITTGANRVIMGLTGSVSRTSGHVIGNLQKPVAIGPTSLTFEVGDTNNYSPVGVVFASVTSAGNLSASATAGEHPNIGTSGIDPHQDVNRYWTISNSGTVFTTYAATLDYGAGDIDGGADPNAFIAQKFDTGAWTWPLVGVRTSTSTEVIGLTSFSDFALGIIKYDTILATGSAHGSLTPSGSIPVLYGADTTFTLRPDSGYVISSVQIDSVVVGPDTVYHFANVRASHTLNVLFGYPAPQLTSIGPVLSSYRGQSVDLVVTGANYINGVTSLNVGAGITVNSLIVQNADTLFANITVNASAVPGSRNFTVTNSQPGGGTSASVKFTVLNHVPATFTLLAPASGDTIRLTTIPRPIAFTWNASADPDAADTLTYLVHILTPIRDTFGIITDTTLSSSTLMALLEPQTTYTWSMVVTDGYDTVAAADTLSFRTSDSVSAVTERGRRMPKEYALHQNYPNPFNPTTEIQFDLPHASVVTLAVYNLLGQETATLIDHRAMSAGYQTVRFDASHLQSGVYLYRISTEQEDGKVFVSVKKMMFLK